jgi:hypothetical protein
MANNSVSPQTTIFGRRSQRVTPCVPSIHRTDGSFGLQGPFVHTVPLIPLAQAELIKQEREHVRLLCDLLGKRRAHSMPGL